LSKSEQWLEDALASGGLDVAWLGNTSDYEDGGAHDKKDGPSIRLGLRTTGGAVRSPASRPRIA
jgi:hypothetical protein